MTEKQASLLLDAYQTKVPVDPFPDMTVDKAYAIQHAQIRERVQRGDRIVGHKIGLTSRAMQRQLGVDQPDFGHLLDSMRLTGNTVRLDDYLAPRAEPEIAFVLARPLIGPHVTISDVVAATAYVVPAIEVIDSRIKDWKIRLGDTIADNGSSGSFLLGTRPTRLDQVNLATVGCVVRVGSEIVSTGAGAAVLGAPLTAVAWLANTVGRLEAGHVVLVGSLTPAVALQPGMTFSAEFLPARLREHLRRRATAVSTVVAAIVGSDTVRVLDKTGVDTIEVTHGDGLGGSTFNFGFSAVDELTLIAAAVEEAQNAKIAVLLLPGVGTVKDLRTAHTAGATVARIATHCTEADVSIQHFGAARDLGMATVGFLMLSHRLGPAELAAQARIMADAGCQCVYVVDSAGALVLDDVAARVRALVDELGDDAEVGFHGHQNLSLGVANSLVAYQNGARQIDGSLCGLGAGAGNAPTEVLVAAFARMGVDTGVDLTGVLDATTDVARKYITRLPWTDRAAIVQGYVGVYSSFLLHAERASARYGVPADKILWEAGRAGYVGGQEDMIIDIALRLSKGAA